MLSKRALLPSVAGSHQARPISLKETDGLQYARNPDLVWLSAASAVPDGALIPQPILFPSPATGAAFAASGLAACHPRAGTGEDQLRHAAHRRPPCWQPSPAEAEAFHDGVREHAGSRPPVIHASQVVADDSRSTLPKRIGSTLTTLWRESEHAAGLDCRTPSSAHTGSTFGRHT